MPYMAKYNQLPKIDFGKDMVEDGHLANSHSYDSSAYYLQDLNAKQNNSRNISSNKNNNNNNNNNNHTGPGSNSCVVVVVERDRRDKSPAPAATVAVDTSSNGSVKNSFVVTSAAAAAAAAAAANNSTTTTSSSQRLDNHLLPAGETTTNWKSAASPLHSTEKTIVNSACSQPQQPSTGAAFASESNGSSHMADHLDASAARAQHLHHNHHPHPASHGHRFYDHEVTKDIEYGGGPRLTAAAAGAPSGAGGGQPPSSDRGFPPEIHKTAIAFGILIFNFFLTTTSLAIIHDKVPSHGPLPDAVLNVFEARNWALIVSEVLIILTTGIMLIIVVTHQHRFIIFRRLFLMLSLLYFMRSVTMFVTVLPVSSHTYYCSPKSKSPGFATYMTRSLTLFFGMGLTLNGKHTFCGDYIYSGHTTILVMSYLMISEYSPRRVRWLHWATWLMSLTGVLMVLLSHSHYTVDVIIGYFVTTRLFWMYHTCANNQFLKKSTRHNYLSREWWYFLFQYFERNVHGPLQPLEYR